jgi:transcriptional regulator with AAA-type ATPase domain
MAGAPADWEKNVAELKKALERSVTLAQELRQVSHNIDIQVARSRKLLKKNPKVNFSQAIQKGEALLPTSMGS